MQYRALKIAGEQGCIVGFALMALLRKQAIGLLEIRVADLLVNLARQAIVLIETLLDGLIDRRAVKQTIQRIVAVPDQWNKAWAGHGLGTLNG